MFFKKKKECDEATYAGWSVSTLGPEMSAVNISAGEIQISPNGRFIYVSNKDMNKPDVETSRSSIVVFEVLVMDYTTYPITYTVLGLQTVNSQGNYPRFVFLDICTLSYINVYVCMYACMYNQLTFVVFTLCKRYFRLLNGGIDLVIANQVDNNFVSFAVDADTGMVDVNSAVVSTPRSPNWLQPSSLLFAQ
jgi:6-phosphogluconolactonase (cycloisomerase 2 family)